MVKQFLTFCFVQLLLLPSFAAAQGDDFGAMDIPQPESVQSGIGMLSGWKCEENGLTVRFDDGPEIAVAYGSSREDTRVPCGDTNNGFGLPWNYNLLNEGRHRVEVFDNGHPFASATFTVTTLGAAFLSGLEGQCTIEEFPFAGEQVALEWQQANQNFVIALWEGECREDTECHSEEFCRKAVGDRDGQGRCQQRAGSADLALQVEVSPGQDLQAAIAANPAGTSFLIKAGIHRMTDAVIPKNNNTFSGEPGAILNGSQVITNFVKSGATWVASGMTMENPVATGDCLSSIIPADEQADVNGVPFDPSASKACTFPNDVYYDHAVLKRVMRADLVVPGTFYFDLARDQIYIGDNPAGHLVEVGVATRAFKGHKTGVEGVIVRGLIVEKFATETGIAAINGRVGWTIENCEVRLNHAVGIQGQFVRNNKIHHNGQFGVSGGGLDSIFEGNEIAYNNYAGYSRGTSGGSKFVYATNLILRNNHVHHNNGPGLWADGDNVDTIYEGNRVEYNATAGIFHEIGYDAVIRNNVVRHNNASQPGKSLWWGANIFLNASQNVEVYGNTIEGRHGLGIVDTGKRGAGKLGARHAQHNNVHDNVFKLTAGERVGTEGVAREASKKNRFVNNIYYLTDLAGPYFNGLTKEGWMALGQDVTGTFILWK